ncbi:MAG: glycine betaine ABC transporter substrate-binding protein [Candidatus Limnocylindria bacterium]
MRQLRTRFLSAIVVLSLALSACTSTGSGASPGGDKPPITIGSKDFTESVILAQIYGQVLEDNGYPVEYKLRVGATELIDPALTSGDIDMYPEYTGTTLVNLMGEEASNDAEAVYEQVAAWYADRGQRALDMTPANDSDGLAVTQATADEYGLKTISDLAAVSSELTLGGPPECAERETCLLGLQDLYGAAFKSFEPIAQGGLKYQALVDEDIDVAVVFTTDGAIAANQLVLLDDDKGLYPAYNIIPVVRNDYLDAAPDDFAELINVASAKITTEELTALNAQVDLELREPEDVAHEWLHEQELIAPD